MKCCFARNRNVRLFLIQRQITEELRFKHRPNLTGSLPLTPTQIEELQAQFNQSEHAASQGQRADAKEDEYSSKKFFALRPTCEFFFFFVFFFFFFFFDLSAGPRQSVAPPLPILCPSLKVSINADPS